MAFHKLAPCPLLPSPPLTRGDPYGRAPTCCMPDLAPSPPDCCLLPLPQSPDRAALGSQATGLHRGHLLDLEADVKIRGVPSSFSFICVFLAMHGSKHRGGVNAKVGGGLQLPGSPGCFQWHRKGTKTLEPQCSQSAWPLEVTVHAQAGKRCYREVQQDTRSMTAAPRGAGTQPVHSCLAPSTTQEHFKSHHHSSHPLQPMQTTTPF